MISDIEKDLKTKEEYFWIKIIDFGTAKIFKKNKNEKAVVGSSYYIAPEFRQKEIEIMTRRVNYGSKSNC